MYVLRGIPVVTIGYSVDLLDYTKQKGTPIGAHIDRVGQVFYEAA